MKETSAEADIVLIGGGIMSATLGMLLHLLNPKFKILIFEQFSEAAIESSDAWNNAGTGHSAFCELNYTPELPDGTVEIHKAVEIAKAFETSKEFWAFLVLERYIQDPSSFINTVPHMSVVWGEQNVRFLKKRHAAMVQHALFRNMQFSEDLQQLKKWMPLIMKDRPETEKIAATFMKDGTDVNFGSLTRLLLDHLSKQPNISLQLSHEVKRLHKKNGRWHLSVEDLENKTRKKISAGFVFIGAGGAALPLLEKSRIPEGKGFGGFPVSGQWLICKNEAVIREHAVKAYGKASVGSPPMSVPHLDTRIIKGTKQLLFGPYAGFTTKFLKNGSAWDLIRSIRFNNIIPMIAAGLQNIPLTKYLVKQVTQSPEERLGALKVFVPAARAEDWELRDAGQRVQIIKKDKRAGGVLEFGTELVSAADGSLAALLGASPGASVSVSIMIGLLEKCFQNELESGWREKIRNMIPSLSKNPEGPDAEKIREKTNELLQLHTERSVRV